MLDLEKLASRSRKMLLTISIIGIVIFVGGLALTLIVISQTARKPGGDWIAGMQSASGLLVLASIGALLACMPLGLMQLVEILHRRANDDRFHRDQLLSVTEAQNKVLARLCDVSSLSDAAKQVAYRAQDLEALRAAIREDLKRGDFEAATLLVNDMERRFGYALEADQIREQITQSSRAAIDQRVTDTVEHVELLLSRHDWDDATRESDRLLRLFPTHADARRLPVKIMTARDDHKRDLLKQWKEAVARDDVNKSIELLHELDQYLSGSEAEAYKESARDVFRKKLQQLGVQFALHVHDRNWSEALRLGREITDEYPNTRMAQEVRERLPILQEKANQPAAV